jgi:hypothetical protein
VRIELEITEPVELGGEQGRGRTESGGLGGAVYESFDAGQRWTKLADSGNVVPYLVIQEGGVYVATDQGLVRYGDPLPPPAPVTGVDFGSLLHPTNGQMVILILTLLFAALALAGPGNWLPGHRRSMA